MTGTCAGQAVQLAEPEVQRSYQEEEAGWDAWAQKEFLNVNREWQAVSDFFAALVRGDTSLTALGLQEPHLFTLDIAPERGNGADDGPSDTPRPATPEDAERCCEDPMDAAGSRPLLPAAGREEGQPGGAACERQGSVTPAEPPAGHECSQAARRGGDPGAATTTAVHVNGCSAVCHVEAGSQASSGGDRTAARPGRQGGGRGGGGARESAARQRITYKVSINYWGGAFAGWAFQKGRVTVQQTLEDALQALVGPDAPRVLVASAGRTDAGVHAHGMPISFYSWLPLEPAAVVLAVDSAVPGRLRALAVEERPRQFHATFGATWRRYIYLFPLRDPECTQLAAPEFGHDQAAPRSSPTPPQPPVAASNGCGTTERPEPLASEAEGAPSPSPSAHLPGGTGQSSAGHRPPARPHTADTLVPSAAAAPAAPITAFMAGASASVPSASVGAHPRCPPIPPEVYRSDPDVGLLGRMLGRLEGRALDYSACARDTPPGKDGVCTLHWCRCYLATLPRTPASSTAAATIHICADPEEATATVAPPMVRATNGQPQGSSLAATAAAEETKTGNGFGAAPRSPLQAASVPAAASHATEAACVTGASSPERAPVRVVCVELAGNRFLRRMVRVLVSTALREAVGGAAARCGEREEALLECLAAGRVATAMPAPATGLCFAGAGYSD